MAPPDSKNRLAHTVDVDELLEALNQEDSGFITESHNNIVPFLTFYGFKPGTHKVNGTLLYELYTKWTTEPVSKQQFALEIGKYLQKQAHRHKAYYLLDKDSYEINGFLFKLFKENKKFKTKSKVYTTHFETFLSKYNITPGTNWYEGYLLFHLYDKYQYEQNKPNLIGEIQFHQFLKLYFDVRRIGSNKTRWYGINQKLEDIMSKETIKNIREAHVQKKVT